MDLEPIYCAEQIRVPAELAEVLKSYTKEVIRRKPDDLVEFSAFYFANLANIVPVSTAVVQPTIQQISALYRSLSTSGQETQCTLQIDEATKQSVATGIDQDTIEKVLKFGYFEGLIDPVELCALLMTTITVDASGLLENVVRVFGDGNTIDSSICQKVFSAFGKYDERWNNGQLQKGLEKIDRLSLEVLQQLPEVQKIFQHSNEL